MARKSTVALVVPDRNETQEELRKYVEAESKLQKIEAELELKIQKIKDEYSSDIAELQTTMQTASKKIELFALNNKEDLFSKKRSLEMPFGTIGYRVGQWKVAVGRGLSNKVVGLVEMAGLNDLVRTKKELDKEEIIRRREETELMGKLNMLGVEVKQDEKFFIEPNKENLKD